MAITLEACYAKEKIKQEFARHGTPEIVNTDQGSQFTATAFTDVVLTKGCKLSMDWRGALRDTIFVETVLTQREVRARVSQDLRQCQRCAPRHCQVHRRLQQAAAAFKP